MSKTTNARRQRREASVKLRGPARSDAGTTTRVAHQGGPRHGAVAELATAVLAGYLVYDGPRWIGVYQRTDPPRIISTPAGPAEVWEAIDG